MPVEYCVYGLQLLADAPIPGLLPTDSSGSDPAGRLDVRIRLNQRPSWWEDRIIATGTVRYQSPYLNERGQPVLTVRQLERSGWYGIVYADGNEFLVDPQAGEIWSKWSPGVTGPEDSATYLVGPVLGFVLRMRGVCCLHASAVSIGQKIIAFAGPPQAGKSTTAAAFAKLGYPVVSDDIVALVEKDRTFLVRPGYPRLCLWPEAGVSLYGPSRQLPQIIPDVDDWKKCYLDLTEDGHQFQMQSLPLSAIYLLDRRVEDPDCPRVETISTHSAVVTLAANTFMNYLLDSNLRSQEFALLGRVVSGLPVRRAIPHTDPAALPRLCEVILEDYRSITAG